EIVVITPLAEPHLLADEVHGVAWALAHRNVLAVVVNGDRGLMGVFDGPDDIFRSPGGIAPEEDPGAGGFEGDLIDFRHVVAVELNAEIALDPGEGIVLADRENHVV